MFFYLAGLRLTHVVHAITSKLYASRLGSFVSPDTVPIPTPQPATRGGALSFSTTFRPALMMAPLAVELDMHPGAPTTIRVTLSPFRPQHRR